MSETVLVPGARDVRGTLDSPDDGTDRCVIACPPHPKLGGTRTDRRLMAVGDALVERGVACLRFDYGEWDAGRAEQTDAGNACDWAGEHYERVGLFGYSFGALVALCVASDRDDLAAVSVLAPPADLEGLDAAEALADVAAPLQVIYGERDDTVEWEPVVSRAREVGATVDAIPADHHFVGQSDAVGRLAGPFLAENLE